jgi:acetyl esterase/lipase
MKTFSVVLILCCFLPDSGLAQNQQPPIEYASVGPQVSFKSVTELAVIQPEQKIAYGSDPLQFGYLWQANREKHKPLIALIHGGCWLNAFGADHSFPMATALAQNGHPVWSLEYRRTGDDGGGWPGSFADIKLALGQLELLHKHRINTDEIILMGHSAGGHLALLAASELPHINIKQVIGLAAITDISRYALGENSCQQAAPQFMNGLPHERPDAYHQANLIYRQLPEATLLLQGDADKIVPIIQSKLHAIKVEIMNEAGHFDWIHPGSPAFKKLLAVLQP